eukprot:2816566-Pyramimonas_sp.AAC.1
MRLPSGPLEPCGRPCARDVQPRLPMPLWMASSASARIWRADLFGAVSRNRLALEAGGAGDWRSTTGPGNKISSSIQVSRVARPPRTTT